MTVLFHFFAYNICCGIDSNSNMVYSQRESKTVYTAVPTQERR